MEIAAIEKKYRRLLGYLQQQGKIVVAFSGGIDSTMLLFAAIEALGAASVLPLHITSLLNSAVSVDNTRTVYKDNFSAFQLVPGYQGVKIEKNR